MVPLSSHAGHIYRVHFLHAAECEKGNGNRMCAGFADFRLQTSAACMSGLVRAGPTLKNFGIQRVGASMQIAAIIKRPVLSSLSCREDAHLPEVSRWYHPTIRTR